MYKVSAARPEVRMKPTQTDLNDRRRIAYAAVDQACRDILGPSGVLEVEFKRVCERIVNLILPLTFLDEIYLAPENLAWAVRSVLLLAKENRPQIGLQEPGDLVRRLFSGLDQDMGEPAIPAGMTYQKLVKDLTTCRGIKSSSWIA
jgi:hypothetical protein